MKLELNSVRLSSHTFALTSQCPSKSEPQLFYSILIVWWSTGSSRRNRWTNWRIKNTYWCQNFDSMWKFKSFFVHFFLQKLMFYENSCFTRFYRLNESNVKCAVSEWSILLKFISISEIKQSQLFTSRDSFSLHSFAVDSYEFIAFVGRTIVSSTRLVCDGQNSNV